MKKLLSLLLTLALAPTILPMSIAAADNTVYQATVKNIATPLPGQYLPDYRDTTESTEEGKYYVVNKDCYWTDVSGMQISDTIGFYKGSTYFYSIVLKAHDGYIFSRDTSIAVKDKTANPSVETVIGNGGHEITFKNAYKVICEEVPNIASVTLSNDNFYYNGKVHKPSVETVLDTNGNVVDSSYYSINYSNNHSKTVGVYTVEIVAKNLATGGATAKYNICPSAPRSVKAKGAKKAVKVSWKRPSSGKPDDYDVFVYSDPSCKNIVTSASVTGTNKTIGSLESGKTYYVRVDCHVQKDNRMLVSKPSRTVQVCPK